MRHLLGTEHQSACFELLGDLRVGVFDEDSAPRGDLRDEGTIGLNR